DREQRVEGLEHQCLVLLLDRLTHGLGPPSRLLTRTSKGVFWRDRRLALPALPAHPDNELAEVAPLQHADEGLRRPLQPIDEVLAIADAATRDAGTYLP